MVATQAPWFDSFKSLGIGLADTLNESVQIYANSKIEKELARHLTNSDASKNQDVNAANAPDKGKDADGANLSESTGQVQAESRLPFGLTETHLKYIGGGMAALVAGALVYKAVK